MVTTRRMPCSLLRSAPATVVERLADAVEPRGVMFIVRMPEAIVHTEPPVEVRVQPVADEKFPLVIWVATATRSTVAPFTIGRARRLVNSMSAVSSAPKMNGRLRPC